MYASEPIGVQPSPVRSFAMIGSEGDAPDLGRGFVAPGRVIQAECLRPHQPGTWRRTARWLVWFEDGFWPQEVIPNGKPRQW